MSGRIVVLLIAISGAQAENSLTRQERREGYNLLFDGKKLTDWHSIKQRPDAGGWLVRKGVLTWEKGGSWLATDETYYDFVLRLEYRTGEGSNSGIFLRALPTGNPAFSGMELQIRSDHGKPPDLHSTASLYGAAAPAKNTAKPNGEWNQVEVAVENRHLTAIWNSEKVLDADLDDPRYDGAQERPLKQRAAFGHVGLQAYTSGAPVEFRNIRIKALRIGPGFSSSQSK
ncbi:MAG: 3-keto-disaccharide hydrolase [Bryobacteraceae bacterium]